jgi:hypothetical protein
VFRKLLQIGYIFIITIKGRVEMKTILNHISRKVSFIAAVTSATVLGGITTAIVWASIPDGSGVIHGCYRNSNGALHTIDTDKGETCTAQETALNWNQQGPKGDQGNPGPQGPAGSSSAIPEYDANGQLLGNFIDDGGAFYIPSLNRVTSTSNTGFPGINAPNIYQSTDCSGQPYITSTTAAKLRLYRVGPDSYAVIQDNAQPQTITEGSIGSVNDNGVTCTARTGSVSAYIPTPVTLPFATPVATPLKLTAN